MSARRVVILHRVIVVLARGGDTILGARHFVLCLQKIFVRLQLRILFLQHQQTTDGPAEAVRGVHYRLLLFRGLVARVALRLSAGGVEQLRTGLGDRAENLLLLHAGELCRFDQIAEQIVATLKLGFNVGPFRLHVLMFGLQSVVAAAGRRKRKQNQD